MVTSSRFAGAHAAAHAPALRATPLDDAPRLDQLAAAQLFRFVSILQCRLNRLVVTAGTGNDDRQVQRDAPTPDCRQQSPFPVLEQIQNAMDVFLTQSGLLGDDLLVVPLVAQLLDAGQELQRTEFAPRDILRRVYDEGGFVVHLGDHRRNFVLADGLGRP